MHTNDVVFTILITTLIIFLLIAGIVITLLISHRRAEKSRRQMARLELDYQKELRTIESEVQEATLAHIASELHDNIGQLLTYMKLQVEKEKLRQPAIEPALNPISQTLQTTMQQVRLLSHSLSNDFITDGGLQRIIGQEAERLRGLGRFTVHFDTDGAEPVLSKDARTIAFRIFQEALSNALRHSGAQHINITLQGRGVFFLQLCDDGKGFDKAAATQESGGLGLKNMQRRAALAGLQCDIDTAPQKGCKFTITSVSIPQSAA
jgi:signal transduction histidine kinase